MNVAKNLEIAAFYFPDQIAIIDGHGGCWRKPGYLDPTKRHFYRLWNFD